MLDSLRSDEEEMRKMLDGQRAVKAQVELAVQVFEKQKGDIEFYIRRMEKYESGELGRDMQAKYDEANRLYEQVAALEERKYKLEHGIAESEDEGRDDDDVEMEADEDDTAKGKRSKT